MEIIAVAAESLGAWGHGGRTLQRIRSSKFVRAAESVRRLDPARAPTFQFTRRAA
jgi:hypothetical protein